MSGGLSLFRKRSILLMKCLGVKTQRTSGQNFVFGFKAKNIARLLIFRFFEMQKTGVGKAGPNLTCFVSFTYSELESCANRLTWKAFLHFL